MKGERGRTTMRKAKGGKTRGKGEKRKKGGGVCHKRSHCHDPRGHEGKCGKHINSREIDKRISI